MPSTQSVDMEAAATTQSLNWTQASSAMSARNREAPAVSRERVRPLGLHDQTEYDGGPPVRKSL